MTAVTAMPEPTAPQEEDQPRPTSRREAALDALLDGWQEDGPDRTNHLLTALTHAVLAISEPPTVPEHALAPTTAPRAMQLLALMRSAGGVWDGKRALAAYEVLGVKSDGVRPLDAQTARRDLINLADAGLVHRVDASRTFAVGG
ncbi:hypothetical protein [Streptomyces cylindrosporus]|uniref:Uncharacterized protein n=1 Tax=Streptomyces cylindrosporus TaxID=2927583 RepID=A0ABS9YJZ6_9ACTN|nr:hypothetical protein [Streptomyces cylindrosporus]MCI3277509.1 hypothetical protein [Streptomyces cylindrosporus]